MQIVSEFEECKLGAVMEANAIRICLRGNGDILQNNCPVLFKNGKIMKDRINID